MSKPIFVCTVCGEEHDLGKLSLGSAAPDQWGRLTTDEQNASELGEDLCVIEAKGERHYFVRGCIEIPVQETKLPFVWGVWCSLSESSMKEMLESWDDASRTNLGPYFGWLCTRIPTYPDTIFLKTRVVQREVGTRPLVFLEETDHDLAIHQRDGIGLSQLQERVKQVLHG